MTHDAVSGQQILAELQALREQIASLENDQLLSEREAADLRRCSVHTLRRERFEGRGPAYVKDPTTGAIRYRRGDLRQFIASQLVKPKRATNAPDFSAIGGAPQ